MFEHALAPHGPRAAATHEQAEAFARLGQDLQAAAVRAFWSRDRGLFVDNLPWLAEEGAARACTTASLATAHPLRPVPQRQHGRRPSRRWPTARRRWASRIRATPAGATGRWRGSGASTSCCKDFRDALGDDALGAAEQHAAGDLERPAGLAAAVEPLPGRAALRAVHGLAGIRPLAPGFARCEIRPQLADLERSLTAHTVRGPIEFEATRSDPSDPSGLPTVTSPDRSLNPKGLALAHRVTVALPAGCEGELLLPPGAPADLPTLSPDHPLGLKRYRLAAGTTHYFTTR